MTSYDNEENAVVVNEGGISETPSNLVNDNLDLETEQPKLDEKLKYKKDGNVDESKLSPNPAGFGFTKQLIVTELPVSGTVNTLYLVKVTDGGKFIGYRLFKWTKLDGFVQYGATPDLLLKDGPRETPVHENNAPKKAPEKVFTGDVVFYEEPIIKGKPLHEYIDSQGGVTEAELQAAINALSQTLTGQINQKQDKITTTSAPAGSVEKLLGFNSEGEIVSGDVPAGSTIDNDLDSTSPNPVKNSGIVEGLEKDIVNGYDSTATYAVGELCLYNGVLYKCVTAITAAEDWTVAHWTQVNIDNEFVHKSELEDYAKVDGNYPTMTVGVADQLSPYDDESGDDQDEPFSFQATGTGNGSQPDFSTGAIALMKEKQGNTVVVNQKVQNPNFDGTTNWDGYHATLSSSNNILSITPDNGVSSCEIHQQGVPVVEGHKVFILLEFKTNTPLSGVAIGGLGSGVIEYVTEAERTAAQNGFVVHTGINTVGSGSPYYYDLYFYKDTFSTGDVIQVKNAIFVDLTQWFNGDIPEDLLDNPENFFRYYQGDLSYNTGELVNANSQYVKCIGRQQWDEEVDSGHGLDDDGTRQTTSGFMSNNYIPVIPNKTYYLYLGGEDVYLKVAFFDAQNNFIKIVKLTYHNGSLIDVPSNAVKMLFDVPSEYSGTTYNHDITISIYYEGESDYDQYYPYEVLTNNDTGEEILRSAGSVYDSKAPYGTITRRVGTYTFTGSESWTWESSNQFWYCGYPASMSDAYTPTQENICSNGLTITFAGVNIRVYASDNTQITSESDLNNIFKSGVVINYRLATPTTEQGTPYSENLVIDDFGSMDFSGTSGVPQGNLIFYPVDYKAFIDTLYNYTDGTPSSIALKSDLATVDNKIGAKLPECPTTTDGTYVLKATVSDGTVVYNWVLEE